MAHSSTFGAQHAVLKFIKSQVKKTMTKKSEHQSSTVFYHSSFKQIDFVVNVNNIKNFDYLLNRKKNLQIYYSPNQFVKVYLALLFLFLR